MIGSFFLGVIGFFVKLTGILFLILSLFVATQNAGAGEFWAGCSIAVICLGAYLSYVSRQSVRIRG